MFGDYSDDDLNTILSGTVIRYNKSPILVNNVNYEEIEFNYLTDRLSIHRVSKYDEGFSISDLTTGNLNYNKGVSYVARVPLRRWKAGLCSSNLRVVHRDFERDYLARVLALRLNNKAFHSMMQRNYPSLDNCLNKLEGKGETHHIAFDREFSVDGFFNLFYKGGVHVGKVSPTSGKVSLKKDFKHLRYALKV